MTADLWFPPGMAAAAQAVVDSLPPCDLPGSSLRVLDALEREYRANGGWPVSCHTICLRAGLRSKSSAHLHLSRLVIAGVAERGPGRFDGWRPVSGGGFR